MAAQRERAPEARQTAQQTNISTPLGFLRPLFLAVATPVEPLPSWPPASDSVMLKRVWYPFIFHASNTILHALCTALVYAVAFCLFHMHAAPNSADSQLARRRSILLALISSLIFACHPIHTEAVSSVVGHAELLCAAWFLVALLLWIQSARNVYRSGAGYNASPATRLMRSQTDLLYTLGSLVCFFISVLSKEIGFTGVAVLLAVDTLLAASRVAESSSIPSSTAASKQQRNVRGASSPMSASVMEFLKLVWIRFALSIGVAAFYLLMRRALAGQMLGVGTVVFRKVENPLAFEPDLWSRFRTHAMMHAKYFQLLVWPVNLCCDYSLDCMPIVREWSDSRWMPGVALWLATVLTCIWAARKMLQTLISVWNNRTAKKQDAAVSVQISSNMSAVSFHSTVYSSLLLSLSLLLFPFLPSSNLFFYVGTFIAERVLYLPSVGACLLIALALERAAFHSMEWWKRPAVAEQEQERKEAKRVTNINGLLVEETISTGASSSGSLSLHLMLRVLLLSMLIIGMTLWGCMATYVRNPAWNSQTALFSSGYEVCPRSIKMLQAWGILLRRQGNPTRALELFREIPPIDPGQIDHHKQMLLLLSHHLRCGLTLVRF
jgi:hypothetical protein